jgi:1-acyl-sn-glycerol-3-phosphate acyltransferase
MMQNKPPHPRTDPAADTSARLIAVVRRVAEELRPSVRDIPVSLESSLDRDLAFDSLGRAELVARIEEAFEVTLPEAVFAEAESPRDLLDAVLEASRREPATPAPGPAADLGVETAGAVDAIPHDATTLVEALRWHEATHPRRVHVRFYADEGEGKTLTYGALATGARRIAAALQKRAIGPGDAVSLILPTGRDYCLVFIGVLLAGGVPVPAYPPTHPSRIEEHLRRLLGILNNCRARALITTPETLAATRVVRAGLPDLAFVATPETLLSEAGQLSPPVSNPDDLALIQYTSGSTGDPKGVMLTHANLLANIRAMAAAIDAGSDDVFVSWLPLYHDMGLIAAWLGSLYQAMPLVLMSPLQFLARPARWLKAISRYNGTLSGGPNFAYELCLRRIADEHLSGLDLGSWRVAFSGAEPVNPDTIERFCRRFAAHGLRREAVMPVYGLAENSVGLAFPPLLRGPCIDTIRREAFQSAGEAIPAEADDPSALRFPACGQPIAGHQIRIVDSAGRELPDRREGRVQFRGPSATQGYCRNPDATRRLFDGEWLETGDRGYIATGDLHVTGRTKDIIIRAGRNIHPSDIEAAVGDLEGVLPGGVAAFGSADLSSGTERLIVLAETRLRRDDALEQLRARINAVVADHVGDPPDEVVLAPPGTIPRTSSGKIRRAASRQVYESRGIGRPHDPPWRQLLRVFLDALVSRLRHWRTETSAVLFAGYAWTAVALVAPTAWIAAMALPGMAARWRALRFCALALAAVTGTRVRIDGLENLPEGPCVLCANHSSYLDGPVLVAVLPRPAGFVAKAELAGPWLTRLPLERIGTLFVRRFDMRAGQADYEAIRRAASEGRTPLFFPEGTLRRMPGLLPFHMGAFATAVETDLTVVPIAVRGTRSMLRDGSWFPRRGEISVTVCPPVAPDPAGSPWDKTVALRDRVRAAILEHCGEPDLERERVEW